MSIDIQALQLLRWAASKSNGLGNVATLGRQGVHVSTEKLRRMLSLPTSYQSSLYCEDLLTRGFGATLVESFDNSDFEGCTHVANFNNPIVPPRQYNTVLDFGCLEHIFNVPQALQNVSLLCGEGGQILHYLPANNHCGHGFWQFSPELFFSLYSEQNGYTDTQVFLVDTGNTKVWYEVIPPSNGQRANVWSDSHLYVLCRTVRRGSFSHENIQQSDYVFEWSKKTDKTPLAKVDVSPIVNWKAILRQSRLLTFLHLKFAALFGLKRYGLTTRHPFLVKRKAPFSR